MRKLSIIMVSMIATAVASLPAAAGRPPTAQEREAIETALRDQGYSSWQEIEYERGYWEVENARMANEAGMADGKEYDLKLDPRTFSIIEIDEDE